MKLYYVYFLASIKRVLYIGVTGEFDRRLAEHRAHKYPQCFTARYNVTRLVYFEEYALIDEAIAREKQLKRWRRSKKDRLVEGMNPAWVDLAPMRPGI